MAGNEASKKKSVKKKEKSSSSSSKKAESNSGKKKESKKSEDRSKELLLENFASLQKVMLNLSEKIDNLTNQTSNLLQLFEESARNMAKKEIEKEEKPDEEKIDKTLEEFRDKMETLMDQNKTIAKGLTLMHETLSGEEIPEEKPQPKPLPKPRQQAPPQPQQPQPPQQPPQQSRPQPPQQNPRPQQPQPSQQNQAQGSAGSLAKEQGSEGFQGYQESSV